MNVKGSTVAALASLGVAVAVYSAYRFGEHQGAASAPAHTPAASAASERKILYWHDPMVPGQRFDKPGKSPYMDMPLVPVYADETPSGGVTVTPGMTQNLGLRTATVRRGTAVSEVATQGVVTQNERATVVVQSRSMGYVERLYVRAALDPVTKGQRLATVYAPEWAGALTEYLALRKSNVDASIVAAARERLRLLSIPDEAVARGERDGVAESRFTLTAPIGGVVAELGVREGMQVQPGVALFRIVDLSRVWVEANVPEAQAAALRVGMQAQAISDAYADRVFSGSVSAILPQVDTATRTLRARVEVANPGLLLKPGMFVRVTTRMPMSRDVLLVPQEAVIATGKRNVVIVANEGNRFEPVAVTLGRPTGSDIEVTQGLSEGQKVVTSSQFLIDSEASLKSALSRLGSAPPNAASAASTSYHAEGIVDSVDGDGLTIAHGPVPALQWPAMTMQFRTALAGAHVHAKRGDRIAFDFVERNGEYQITRVLPLPGAKP